MLKIITDKRQIERLHNRFTNKLNEVFTEEFECTVGHPHGSFKDTVKYSLNLTCGFLNSDIQIDFGMALVWEDLVL